MKTQLILLLLVSLTVSFKLQKGTKSTESIDIITTGSCSDSRIKTVNDSISQCEFYGMQLTTQCIKNYLFNHTNSEKWDVMVELPDKTDARESYWFYNDCSIRYEKYGTLKLTYTIWKATQSDQTETSKIMEYFSSDNLSLQPNDECTQNRTKMATDAINYCHNPDMTMETSCIRNNIKSKSGQKWNAVVSESSKSQFYIRFDYFDGCSLKLDNFGPRKRNYIVWKAQ